ncbi:hypothetical protein AB0B62_01185 [Micromonospora chalcea]
MAKLWHRLVVQLLAPDRHASARGTTWSMPTSEAAVQVAPSYGLYQRPDTAGQWRAQEGGTAAGVQSRLRHGG